MELPTVLLVTWLVHGQPPNSYQTTFTSKATCEAAKDKVLAAGIEGNVPIDVENGESLLPLVTLRGLHLLSKCGVV